MYRFIAFALVLTQSVCAQNIAEVAIADGRFTTLVTLLQQANLADTIANGGPFTVFAPTDDAFAKLDAATLNAVQSDPALLTQVLTYHVVSGTVKSNQLSNDMTAPSLEGTPLRFNIYSGGKTVTVNGKRVIIPDVEASNGVIHVVDEVIVPLPDKNIAELVVANPNLSTLLAAVSAADLVDTLSSEGPFTVFAPTNEAFEKLPAGTLDAILADKDLLTQTLLRHVVPQTLYSAGIVTGMVETAGGEAIRTVAKANRVRRGTGNNAKVVIKDIVALNGVVHAIDKVL